jgi:hypothetical protein
MTDEIEDDDEELTPEEEEAWCAEQRAEVTAYLARQTGLTHGAIGEWPAGYLAPYLSIWAVESLRAPGEVGWWAISGDLPTDYCSSAEAPDPRTALRHFAQSWTAALSEMKSEDTTIGETGLPAELADLLRSRAEFLLDWANDDEAWEEDGAWKEDAEDDSSTNLQ